MSASTSAKSQARSTGRVKRFAHKTRTGCLTCRKRRIKCDEAKPICQRCMKSDLVCQGYLDVPISNTRRASSSRCSTLSTQSNPTSPLAAPLLDYSSERDQVPDFNDLCTSGPTFPCLASTSVDVRPWASLIKPLVVACSGTHGFWDSFVPQLTWSFASTSHAVTAISILFTSFHKRKHDEDAFTKASIEMTTHINLAIQASIHEMAPTHVVIVLACLLWVFETLNGRPDNAAMHSQNIRRMALKLIDESRGRGDSNADYVLKNMPRPQTASANSLSTTIKNGLAPKVRKAVLIATLETALEGITSLNNEVFASGGYPDKNLHALLSSIQADIEWVTSRWGLEHSAASPGSTTSLSSSSSSWNSLKCWAESPFANVLAEVRSSLPGLLSEAELQHLKTKTEKIMPALLFGAALDDLDMRQDVFEFLSIYGSHARIRDSDSNSKNLTSSFEHDPIALFTDYNEDHSMMGFSGHIPTISWDEYTCVS